MTDAAAPAEDPRPISGADAPGIGEAIHSIGEAGKESLDSGRDIVRAMRRLVAADIAQARIVLARAAVWLGVAVAFGASAWLLVMAALIVGLNHIGLSWLAATSISAVVSVVIAGVGAWQALRYFEMARFEASRKQLAHLTRRSSEDEEDEVRKPNLAQVQRRIDRASEVLDGRREQLRENLQQVRGTWKASWTPLRIVLSGLGLGFVFGKMDPEKAATGLAGKFGAAPKVLQTLTALSGLFAASRAQAASESADEAADTAQHASAGDVPPARPYAPPPGHGHPPRPAEAATELSDP